MSKAENLPVWSEQDEVLRRRYLEAIEAGLKDKDAQVFAESFRDIGELRRAVKKGCPPRLLARILL